MSSLKGQLQNARPGRVLCLAKPAHFGHVNLELLMEMRGYEESRTTTHYWGYRELSPEELLMVGGGDDGGGTEGAGDRDGDVGGGAVSQGDNGSLDVAGFTQSEAKNMCIAQCSVTSLPTNDFGFGFFNCVNSCMSQFGF